MRHFIRIQTKRGSVDHVEALVGTFRTLCGKKTLPTYTTENWSDYHERRLCKRCANEAREMVAELEAQLEGEGV